MRIKTETIFDIIIVAAGDYKSRYSDANKERKAALKRLKNELVPDTPRYRAEQAQIEADFQMALTESREKILAEVMPELQGAKQRAQNALTVTEQETRRMDVLRRFSDMPLSQREINILADKYGGGYWSDRYISQLAEKNNCEYLSGGAEIGEKLDVLDQLESNINNFLNGYSGKENTSYEVLRSVSENTVFDLEQKFTRNYADTKLSPEQKAQRVLAMCRNQPDFLSKSMALANSYKNADTRTRQFIITLCAEDERLTDVLRMAGLNNRVDAFKENGLSDMKKAIKTVNEAQKQTEVTEIAATLDSAGNNPFLAELIADALESTDNEHFRQAVEKSNVSDLLRAKKEIETESELDDTAE